ncbi:bifunctional riboflavin kinase/FAD synthetase [Longirhabdus pacifica]|uniref:bifunctional riboflavin kinase/FAD synthetase n=1 Tax=Longirhabdus pacifica TaxID=2305227 RepID=UPI00100939BB|nr:bifunctional riboflavin kinase/FAD synthetase [Longirhabdus pacifica]
MEIIHLNYPISLSDFPVEDQVIAIGDFDGIHRGHQQVIGQAQRKAKQCGAKSAVMTFHPHPREVLGKSMYARSLAPFQDKMKRLKQLGIDYTYVIHFNASFAKLTPDQFVHQVLNKLSLKAVVVGFDFRFGHRGAGTVQTLRDLCGSDVDVSVVDSFQLDAMKVSSTSIRELLSQGEIKAVTNYLGRPYAIVGTVIHGDARGRQIGFPTANLQLVESYVLPKNGVYAVTAVIDDKAYEAIMNIGNRPTFKSDHEAKSVEVHLFNFNESIYGQEIHVELMEFVRDEKKFSSIDELVLQINEDIKKVKQMSLSC